MKTLLKLFFALVLIIILLLVGTLTYFGFMPGLSTVFGTNKPKNLGIVTSEKDYQSFVDKTKTEMAIINEPATPEKSIVFEGSAPLTGEFSEVETSSRLANSKWRYMPVSNTQLRFNNGGLEFSATLRTDRLGGFLSAIGGVNVTQQDVEKGLNLLGVMPSNPPIYAKAQVSVENNMVSVNLENLEVGRIPVPLNEVKLNSPVKTLAEHIINRTPGLKIDSVKFENGKMVFSGTVPTKISLESLR